MATLPFPALLTYKEYEPTAVFKLPWLALRDNLPIAVLLVPIVLNRNAVLPTAVLLTPVVL